jgi:hypothetical protein
LVGWGKVLSLGDKPTVLRKMGKKMTQPPPPPTVSQGDPHSKIATAIILAAVILGGIFIIATIDLIQCPMCKGYYLTRLFCTTCGHDGKVTVLQYLMYYI